MLLVLLVVQRVPNSPATAVVKSRQARMSMVRDVTAGAWPDDIAAQMVNV